MGNLDDFCQMESKSGDCRANARPCRKCLSGFCLLSGDQKFFALAAAWPYVGVEHQVPHLARAYYSGSLLSTQLIFYHLLGKYEPNFPGTPLLHLSKYSLWFLITFERQKTCKANSCQNCLSEEKESVTTCLSRNTELVGSVSFSKETEPKQNERMQRNSTMLLELIG